jgi:hypothetical protein
MSNILCMAVSKIKPSGKLEYNKQLGAENTYKVYQAMSEIVIHSAETFIQEDFEYVIFQDEVDSYQEIFHKNFDHVYSEFHTEDGPHNILFLDCDTLVVGPVEVFGKFDRFQLFNYTDPKTLSGDDANNKYGLQHEHYFNAGVRYYPSTMSKEVWDLGWSYARDWDYNIWGTEQIIFNQMMYSQDPDVKTWLRPDMNFQAMNVPFGDVDDPALQSYLKNWNGIHMNDAKIMHLHGTRGAANTLLLQWELWRRITGEEFEFSTLKVVKNSSGAPIDIEFK